MRSLDTKAEKDFIRCFSYNSVQRLFIIPILMHNCFTHADPFGS